MDLQAILDAPSSDSSVTHDEDDVVAAHSDDNVFSQSTVSNLSNTTEEVAAMSVVDSFLGTRRSEFTNNDTGGNETNVLHSTMDGASGIRHEFGEDERGEDEQFDSEIVDRILMKKHSRERGGGLQRLRSCNAGGGGGREVGTAATPSGGKNSTSSSSELERILMEADADDCDDDNVSDEGGDIRYHMHDKYDNDRYEKGHCFSRGGRSSLVATKANSDPYHGINGIGVSAGRNKISSTNNESMDFLLQSILNEDDDNFDDDEDIDAHDDYDCNFPSAADERGRWIVGTDAKSEKQNKYVIPSLHSMEVDAILNSVQDDDNEEDDLDFHSNGIASLSKKRDIQYSRGYRGFTSTISSCHRQPNDSDSSNSSSDENGDDWCGGYNTDDTFRGVQQQRSRIENDMAYDKDNISKMQYPITRIEGEGNLHTEQQQVQDPKALDLRRKQQDINHDKATEDEQRLSLNNQQRAVQVTKDDDDDRACALSALRLQQAENAERKLLSSNSNSDATVTRSFVSPLTVKRRMRPRVELMTKVQASSSVAVDQAKSSSYQHQRLHSNQACQQQQQPRFGFSGGIIQMKSIISTLGRREHSPQLLNDENYIDKRTLSSSESSVATAAAAGKSTTGTNGEVLLPTALAVNSKFIAIGNQGGEVLVFDLYEQLKIILGKSQQKQHGTTVDVVGGGGGVRRSDVTPSTSATSHFGSVTSIDLSSHGDYLLAGYVTGCIVLWDVIKGSMLKHVADLHTSSICSARFTFASMCGLGYGTGDEKLGAVSIDAGGLVNKLVFSQGRLVVWSSSYSVETECLLDGTAGQILAMDVLPPLDMISTDTGDPAAVQSSMHQHKTTFDSRIVLIALSSGRSSFAVSVEPKVSVLHRWARPSMERIDPSRSDDDRLTQASSNYASTYVSSYTNASCASTYVSTSTYQSNDSIAMERQLVQSKSSVDSTPVPFLPCLSWGWALVCGGGHCVTPILARAWGCCLQFLRASAPLDMEDYVPGKNASVGDNPAASVHWPAFGTHDEFDASAPVVALNWLGKRSLVYLTISNEFIMIDTVIMTMQERLDFSQIKLVYAEFALSRSSSSASRLRHPGSNACCTTFMNSFRLSDNRLFILCQGEAKEITALGMRQQIMSLEDSGQWLEALALALDHYESTIMSQEDNKRNSDPTSLVLKNYDVMTRLNLSLLTDDEVWISDLLMRYLMLAVDNAPDSTPVRTASTNANFLSRPNLTESHFEMLSGKVLLCYRVTCYSFSGLSLFTFFTYIVS